MKPLKFVLVLLIGLSGKVTLAQSDTTVNWKLVKPTKVFKAFGHYWQRNGNNYQIDISLTGSKPKVDFNFVNGLMASKEIQKLLIEEENSGIRINSPNYIYFHERQYYSEKPSSFAMGFLTSYDLMPDKPLKWTRELRVGALFQQVNSGYVFRNYSFNPIGYNQKVESQYYAAFNTKGIRLQSDFLMNHKGIKNFLSFYAGVGLRVAPHFIVSTDYGYDRSYRMFDTAFSTEYNNLIDQNDSPYVNFNPGWNSKFSMQYGVSAIAGIKLNLTCHINLFMEYQQLLLFDTYFGYQTNMHIGNSFQFGIRRKLNVLTENAPPEEYTPSPFY